MDYGRQFPTRSHQRHLSFHSFHIYHQWETPLSLAASDFKPGNPDYMTPQFERMTEKNLGPFFYPMSAGVNVQKEINKWLSVGFSLPIRCCVGNIRYTVDNLYRQSKHTLHRYPGGHYLRAEYKVAYGICRRRRRVDRAVADEYVCQLNDVATRQFNP